MNKVICDICGTSYPDTEDKCPICGYSRELNEIPMTDHIGLDLDESLEVTEETAKPDLVEEPAEQEQGSEAVEADANVNNSNDVVINEAEENDADDDDEEEEDEEEEEERRSSPLLIFLLILVILALLAVAGYIFVKYYLPTMKPEETVPETTTAIVETTEATDSTVPCTSLVMTSDGEVTLEQEGANWMIHVVAMPEDTTDAVVYESSDESVVTVSESGLVTAVGEGSAVITVTCGEHQVTMDIICAFVEESSVPDVTQPGTEPTTEGETGAPTEEATEAPTEEATEPATEPAGDLVLTLNKSDITFNYVGAVYTLKVTKGIDPADVEWVSSNGNVCYANDGVLSIVGYGTATIYARYQGQEVSCIVRVTSK